MPRSPRYGGIGAGGPYLVRGGDSGQDPFRVRRVAVEDQDAPWAVGAERWDDGLHG